ncbi:hypothetical protein DJ568_15075 [Mucilaginibacter hurinus]|uniref:Uncharacterized protein n=1 Tax=Mucilaginibacter hurinus TaxID=2201324 RepID=A0A367GMF0_9SPHI|nr:hypothetical protein DJ568_15075 [Mucilaginibacter hurinus]
MYQQIAINKTNPEKSEGFLFIGLTVNVVSKGRSGYRPFIKCPGGFMPHPINGSIYSRGYATLSNGEGIIGIASCSVIHGARFMQKPHPIKGCIESRGCAALSIGEGIIGNASCSTIDG